MKKTTQEKNIIADNKELINLREQYEENYNEFITEVDNLLEAADKLINRFKSGSLDIKHMDLYKPILSLKLSDEKMSGGEQPYVLTYTNKKSKKLI